MGTIKVIIIELITADKKKLENDFVNFFFPCFYFPEEGLFMLSGTFPFQNKNVVKDLMPKPYGK